MSWFNWDYCQVNMYLAIRYRAVCFLDAGNITGSMWDWWFVVQLIPSDGSL